MASLPNPTTHSGGASSEIGFVQKLIFKSGEWFFFVNACVIGCMFLAIILGGTHLVISDFVGGRTIIAGVIMVVLAALTILNAEYEGDWQYPESEDEDEDETEQANEDDAEFETFLEQLAGEFPWLQDEVQQPVPTRRSSGKRRTAASKAVVADLTGNTSHAAAASAAGRDPVQDRLLRLRERLKKMEGVDVVDPASGEPDGEPDDEPERDAEFERLLQRIGAISSRLGRVDGNVAARLPVVAEVGSSEPDAEPPSEQTLESDEALSTLRRRHATEPSPHHSKNCVI